jgi:hypothetical protein
MNNVGAYMCILYILPASLDASPRDRGLSFQKLQEVLWAGVGPFELWLYICCSSSMNLKMAFES